MANYRPTGSQAENDLAMQGQTVLNKTADGSPLDPVTPPWAQPVPSNISVPVISGANPPVVGSIMNCSTGTWSFANSYTYQWKRGGTNIVGATAPSYTVVTADKTFVLVCAVIGINTKGSASANSAPTVAVP